MVAFLALKIVFQWDSLNFIRLNEVYTKFKKKLGRKNKEPKNGRKGQFRT